MKLNHPINFNDRIKKIEDKHLEVSSEVDKKMIELIAKLFVNSVFEPKHLKSTTGKSTQD